MAFISLGHSASHPLKSHPPALSLPSVTGTQFCMVGRPQTGDKCLLSPYYAEQCRVPGFNLAPLRDFYFRCHFSLASLLYYNLQVVIEL